MRLCASELNAWDQANSSDTDSLYVLTVRSAVIDATMVRFDKDLDQALNLEIRSS